MEQKINALCNATKRGYFTKDDANCFGKAGLFIGGSDMEQLGIDEAAAGEHFYRLSAFEVEREVVTQALSLGLTVRKDGEMTCFTFFL
jgi:hypothetical protein